MPADDDCRYSSPTSISLFGGLFSSLFEKWKEEGGSSPHLRRGGGGGGGGGGGEKDTFSLPLSRKMRNSPSVDESSVAAKKEKKTDLVEIFPKSGR